MTPINGIIVHLYFIRFYGFGHLNKQNIYNGLFDHIIITPERLN